MLNNLRQFHCTLCGTITNRIDAHQIRCYSENGCALPTAPMPMFFQQICPECYKELKEAQEQLSSVSSQQAATVATVDPTALGSGDTDRPH